MISVQRCDPPAITPQTVAVVPDALLPMLGWRDIPVLREVRQKLTVLERFVLEMALTLGTVRAEDFAEVVSLPRQVLAAGATRLIAGGALRLVGDGYVVVPETAARALAEEGIRRPMPSTADFVLLPRTGDLLTLPAKKKSWLRQVELARIAPASNAPIPAGLQNQHMAGYLAARIRAGTVTLQDAGVVDVPIPDSDPPLVAQNQRHTGAPLCPAYRCRAEVTRDEHGQHTVQAVLHGMTRRRKKKAGSGEANGTAEVSIHLTGADHLITEWLSLAAHLAEPTTQRTAWQAIGPAPTTHGEQPFHGAQPRGPVEWEFLLTDEAARAVAAERRPLDQPVGLALANDEASVQIVAWFVPADPDARLLFARDFAVSRLLTAANPARDLAAARESAAIELGVPMAELDPVAVRDRAWDLAYYRLVYALREAEDFPYD